jgi:osmoprotectant transport system substrate-binding protein
VVYGAAMRRLILVLAIVSSSCSAASGGSGPSPRPATGDDAITVASFDFTESEILAELYAQAFERDGIRVVRQMRLGSREFVEPALQQGLVEFVPEYTGSLLAFLTRGGPASADLEAVRAALDDQLSDRGLVELDSAAAEDQNAFATTAEFASEHGLRAVSDLADLPPLVLGGPPECELRPLCEPGLEETYGLRFDRFVPLDLSGPLTQDALARGLIDVALVLTTSPILTGDRFVVLEDDLGLQPAEHVTPVLNESVLDRFGPRVATIANRVSSALTTDELRGLNSEVDAGTSTPRQAASAWLDEHGVPSTGSG